MVESTSPEILERAKRNCARDGCRWEPSEPTMLTRLFGYGDADAPLLDEFGRLTYLAEAHWQLHNEANGTRAGRAIA
jgi:hypothetical protein